MSSRDEREKFERLMRESGVNIPDDWQGKAREQHEGEGHTVALTDRPDDPEVDAVFDNVLGIVREAGLKDRQVVELFATILGRSVVNRAVKRGAMEGSEAMVEVIGAAAMPGCFAGFVMLNLTRGKAFSLTASIHHLLTDMVGFGKRGDDRKES